MSYKSNKPVKDTNRKEQFVGILQLFVVISILFMSYVVITGLDDIVSKVMTAPALLWTAVVLINRFSK